MDKPLFQPFPSELTFRNFTPAETYKLQLHLHNNDKVSRHVRPELQESQFFHVIPPKNAGRKVAPGMSVVFTICFTPQENKDYQHTLVFVTERERFEVPVRAIGPRAILDFTEEYHFPTCVVKGSTEVTHLVRNIGNSKANFTLLTHRPFSVAPSAGMLDVFESTQVTVTFNPMTVGDHSQALTLHYHTGENVYIRLYGSCEEVDVHLEPDLVHLTQTYVSLSTVNRTVCLINRHNVPLQYCWTTESSIQEEDLSFMRKNSEFQQHEKEKMDESEPMGIHRLSLQGCRSQAVHDLGLSFSHGCITVEPAEGEIWPNIPVELNIVFKPEEAKLYQETIYCDVAGRESKLPLTIMGEAMGPNLQLNYNVMDMGPVFRGSTHCYEVELVNKGLIDAPFRLSKPVTTFGGCFSMSPDEGVVPSGGTHTVKVSFTSHICGSLSEQLLLTVLGKPEVMSLTFRGRVIGPTFNLSVSDLNFGVVAFGFPKTLSFSVCNTSSVPLNFSMRILGDGLGSPSVSYEGRLSDVSRKNWQFIAAEDVHVRPAEFTISPTSDFVSPQSHVTVEVTLCANTVKTYRLALVVDVEGVGEEIRTLPVNAICAVPDVVLDTPLLDFKRCFLNQACEKKVCLINTSDLPACYGVLDEAHEENQLKLSYTSKSRGVIGPGSSQEIPVILLAKATGKWHHTLHIAVFGSVLPPLEVMVSCIGQGPIVEVQPQLMDFGKILVLKDKTKTLQLLNKSAIPAHFTASLSCPKSMWRVEPSDGEVSAGNQVELKVVAHLNDTFKFKDMLKVSVQHGPTHTVSLSATGTGSPVTSDKPFSPRIDLGTCLSPGSRHYNFRLTNHGQRTRRLYWSTDMSSDPQGATLSGPNMLPHLTNPRKEIRGQRSVPGQGGKPVFRLIPSRLELFPGSSSDMVLMGSSDKPKVVRERLTCRTIVDGHSSYEHIHTVDVTCSFLSSLLSICPENLDFYSEKVLGQDLKPVYKKLVLNNVSSQALSLELCLVEPFCLCEGPGASNSAPTKSASLGVGEQAVIWICFNPPDSLDLISRVLDEVLVIRYLGHSQPVKLHAELHFPNLSFSSTLVDFGYVLNNSETQRQIAMTNCSPLPVSYCWTFLKEHKDIREEETLAAAEGEIISEKEREEGPISPVTIPPGEQEHLTQGTPQVFDIVPNCGHLQPGSQQQVTVSFYAQENTRKEVLAQCRVEGGPTYQIKVQGEATVISYTLDPHHVDFGLLLFDHEAEAEVTLRNTGNVGFEFYIVDPQRRDEADEEAEGPQGGPPQEPCKRSIPKQLSPGQPRFIPSRGHVDVRAEQRLRVLFLPGVADVFEKQVQLQVASLPVQTITVTGEGVPPTARLSLSHTLS